MTSQPSLNYFDTVAGQWDTMRTGYFDESVRTAAIAKAWLRPEMVTADVGAGTGFIAAGLAPLTREVHVIDQSPAMIAVARKNLESFSNIIYHEAEGQKLPLADGSVDAVFANMYLHHCTDPLASIREMVRILKPGGRIVITDMDSHPYAWLKDEMADIWMGFERNQIWDWFRKADLVNIIVDCTGQNCCAKSQEMLKDDPERQAKINVFVATGTRRLVMQSEVKKTYESIAKSSGSCCGSSNQSCCAGKTESPVIKVNFSSGYSREEKALIPNEAEEFSLGCGNPIILAALKPGEVVLDIGSGGGMDSFLAANRVGSSGKVIGIDMTPAMLTRARSSAKKAGIQNVEFRQGQAEALPVDDNSIDVIISNCVINLCEDKGLVFQETFRALKPSGRLEVSDIVTNQPLPLDTRREEWSGCISGALPEKEYLDLITQAGFVEICSRRSTSSGAINGTDVYSIIVSAVKPVDS